MARGGRGGWALAGLALLGLAMLGGKKSEARPSAPEGPKRPGGPPPPAAEDDPLRRFAEETDRIPVASASDPGMGPKQPLPEDPTRGRIPPADPKSPKRPEGERRTKRPGGSGK